MEAGAERPGAKRRERERMSYANVDGLHVELDDRGVLRLRLDRPKRRNALDDTKRYGTPASCAIAFAMYVLPVPGGPSNKIALRGFPPMRSRNVW